MDYLINLLLLPSKTQAAASSLNSMKQECTANGGLYTNGILKGLPCDKPLNDIAQILPIFFRVIENILLPVAGSLFIVMFLLGGIRYITSAGNPQRIEGAKKTLTFAIIGLLIIALSYTMVAVFARILGGSIG